jgi:hypothetical protein
MITKKRLHKTEMELVELCDNIDVDRRDMRKIIIDKFTDLMGEEKEEACLNTKQKCSLKLDIGHRTKEWKAKNG